VARAARADRRGPGRPARLSRDAIVEAALALLERTPHEPLTIGRIAAQVDAVPAALYRHFASLDDLLDAVLAAVLGTVEPEIRARAAWREQVRDWMTSLRDHLLRYPAVLPLIGRRGRTSPAWLDAVSVLVQILERTGLRGAALARAHLWILETTMGLVIQEASLALPEQIEAARRGLVGMTDAGRTRLAPLVPHLGRLDGDAFFTFVVDRTLDGLACMVEAGSS
jgi:TetR/AcrR family transcriptional regulator, tetracycline repressor protein